MIDSATEHTGREWDWTPGIDPDAPTLVSTVKSVFVSCWNLSEYENAALWSIYGKAVAIESTVAGLRDSFAELKESVYIGRVKYIDYQHEDFPTDNAYEAIVNKRRFFEN